MISSLAKVASSLASSLAESEIRLQEAEKEARDSRDALLDVSSELEQVRIARDVDAETISRLVSQVPDIALRDHIQQQEDAVEGSNLAMEEEEGEAQADGRRAVVHRAAEHLAGGVGVEEGEVERAEGLEHAAQLGGPRHLERAQEGAVDL